MYGKLFDSLKYADHLTLGLDADAKGLHLAGFFKVKSDSESAKSITDARTTNLAAIDKLAPARWCTRA